MTKEHQAKVTEKAQPVRQPAEPTALGLEGELAVPGAAIAPGSLFELPRSLQPRQVQRMQRTAGNLAVQRALQNGIIQRQGGGAGNTTPIPALPDHASRQALAIDVLKKAYGDRIKSETKVVTVDSEGALRAEYDRSMIAQGKQFRETNANGEETLRPWQVGDSAKHPDMSREFAGFRDTGNSQIYVDTSKPPDEQVATIAHEMLHASSSGNFIGVLGKGIDEGMTEKLTIDAFTVSGYSVTSGMFAQWVTFANRLCAAFGTGVMTESYFGGTAALRDAINEKMGRGSFLRFTQAVKDGDWATANDMIQRGMVASVEALLDSWWVSDDDIAAVEEIYRTATGEDRQRIRAVIQAQIPNLSSIGQRTRLRVLLASG
jgi:hypothetical protein